MNLDYESLAALSAVVREGSFDGASRALGVTQSAVSQRIKQLEERVGAILIVRGRPCVPTELGLQLCQHLEQVQLLEHDLFQRTAALTGGSPQAPAVLRVAVNSDSLATWFPRVVARATRDLRIQLEITPEDQEFTEQALRSGEALAVVTSVEAPVQGCRRMSLGAMEYVAVATPELVAQMPQEGGRVTDTNGVPCLAFDRKDTLPDQWMMLAFGEVRRALRHYMPSYEGYLSCLTQGVGWGMMPTVTVQGLVQSGELVELVPDVRIHLSLHWKSAAQSSEILSRLSDIVLEEADRVLVPDRFRAA